MAADFTGRRKLVTVHLPIDFGAFNEIQRALLPLYPKDVLFSDVCETRQDTITYYEPPEAS